MNIMFYISRIYYIMAILNRYFLNLYFIHKYIIVIVFLHMGTGLDSVHRYALIKLCVSNLKFKRIFYNKNN